MKIDYSKEFRNEPDYEKDSTLDANWQVWVEDNILKVRFEGTKSFKDVLVDFCFLSSRVKAFDGATWKVHKGFKDAYYSVRNKVLDKAYSLMEGHDYEILVEGHSLGGAMAIIAAEDFSWHFNKKVTLATWGAPRPIVNKKGLNIVKECITEDSYNFEYSSDTVPLLPWFYKKNPKVVHLGKKWNLFKAFSLLKWHTGYNKTDYPTAKLS